MVLSDGQIKEKVGSGEISIAPFDKSCIQPASYDLHLANQFKIYRSHANEIIDPLKSVDGMMENIFLGEGESFILHPGSFALGLIE